MPAIRHPAKALPAFILLLRLALTPLPLRLADTALSLYFVTLSGFFGCDGSDHFQSNDDFAKASFQGHTFLILPAQFGSGIAETYAKSEGA